ncbi:two-component system sensory kinase [Fragilariopsis cylindrus CCMP1102]|uniref:histidine kinase n=1 Tax=Fragilariopsis cylindrus CCMP1102 TaxID=635003 RepID=A0A1E7FVN5_9STRA|nr:two-component system sensory kinase [Fragilariopsis cylindrus CCMP1102]|eukprot:OEU22221.1 two-component system sensory kinase [Fragilariopsis cylindrus CCMP1102]
MEKQIEDRTNELATANINLEKANAQLAIQSAKQLQHFACMSHEIRTPLNCIVGMSSLLLEDDGPSMDPMHADSIRMINTSGELLSAVVDDVLDYAKLESGSFEVDIGLTKLQDTLDSVLYSITQKMQEKNIRIRTHFSPTVPLYLETDSRRLQQVLFNLLGNAGKFSKIDSVIDLSVSLVKAYRDDENNDTIRFSVKDYGKGIDKKDFETIFQPFSQASKETQNVYGGTGLGLSITSKLVHRLGGKISLDSELGKYADFTVDLPMNGRYVDIQKISGKMTSASAKTTTKNPGNITKVLLGKLDLKVLYAEDNIVNQKVLARVLNRYGITDITIVDNGKKAVDISAKTKYDCILLDMQMPIMGGIEACELIMDRDPDSKIVFVTAHALDEFKVKAKSVGAIGFISKPFRVGDIDEVLREIYT